MENSTKKGIMLGVLLLGCGITSLVGGMLGSSNSGTELLKLDRTVQEGNKQYNSKDKLKHGNLLKIYVSGAVVRPGLYDVPAGSRADDAVAEAGGMTLDADPTRVNLALKLKDGMQVNVPYKKQKYQKQYNNSANGYGKTNSYARQSTTAVNTSSKININTATAKELEALPGIGPSMAQKIIVYRNGHRFSRIEDLVKVPGIGKAKLERLRDRIYV